MTKKLIILTAPVGSGKTTALMNWASKNGRIGGVLTPDVADLRKIFRVRDTRSFDFQIADDEASNETIIRIGRFSFLKSAFELMKEILLEDMRSGLDYVIVDELGKLEVKGEGLSEVIRDLIDLYREQQDSPGLILVVRDYLLDDAKRLFGIEDAQIIELQETGSMDFELIDQ